MKTQTLPTDAASILALTWSDYEPLYKELEARPLSSETIEAGAKFALDAETLKEAVDLIEDVVGEIEAKL